MEDKVVYSYEAECAVLGCILNKSDLMDQCTLKALDFYDERNRMIFGYMLLLNDIDTKQIDFNLLMDYAKTDEERSMLGGVTYVANLQTSIITLGNFKTYHDRIIEKSKVRQAMDIMRLKSNDGLYTENANDYISDVIQALENLSDDSDDDEDPVRIGSVLDNHEEILAKRAEALGLTGTKTCSDDLDALTGGWQKQTLNILAARPSIGKTAMLVNEAEEGQLSARKKGIKGSAAWIISIEQPGLPIAERALCALGNMDSNKLKTGMLSEKDWERYHKTKDYLNGLDVFITDKPKVTLQSIKRRAKKMVKKYPNLTIYIDYLQLVDCGNPKINHDPTKNSKAVSGGLKQLARELDIPIVAISAVGRKVDDRQDKRPQMSDLRESGAIESDADVLVFLYRDDYYNHDSIKAGIIELIVAKNREGPVGLVEMLFIKATGRFLKRKIESDGVKNGESHASNE